MQFLAEIAGVVVQRIRRPGLPRPFRRWLYPLPAVVAFPGFVYVLLMRLNSQKEVRLAGLEAEPQCPAVPMGGALLAGGHFSRRFRAVMSERFHNVRRVEARRHPTEVAVRLALSASAAAASLPAASN